MKVIVILFFLSSFTVFGDAGYCYRFFLEVVSKESDTITGYYYHHTFKNYNEHRLSGKDFKSFIKKESIDIYSFIYTMAIGSQPVDFSTMSFKNTLSISNTDLIRVHEFLDFQAGYRLIELTTQQFNLIKNTPPSIEIVYNEKLAENCFYALLSWKNKPDLFPNKTTIMNKLEFFSKDIFKNQHLLNNYLKIKRSQLLEKHILLISLCTAL